MDYPLWIDLLLLAAAIAGAVTTLVGFGKTVTNLVKMRREYLETGRIIWTDAQRTRLRILKHMESIDAKLPTTDDAPGRHERHVE